MSEATPTVMDRIIADALEKDNAFVLIAHFTTKSFSLQHSLKIPGGFKLSEGIRLTSLAIELEFSWDTSLSFSLSVEANAEFDIPNGKYPNGVEKTMTLLAFARLEISISISSVELAAMLSAKLRGKNQFWTNPFGVLPNMGIEFPATVGFGVQVFPVVKPSYFELELHLYGCNTPLVSNLDYNDGTKSSLGDAASGSGLGFVAPWAIPGRIPQPAKAMENPCGQ
jgi:hypothetical protein